MCVWGGGGGYSIVSTVQYPAILTDCLDLFVSSRMASLTLGEGKSSPLCQNLWNTTKRTPWWRSLALSST